MEYGKKFQKSPVNQDITQTTTSVSLNLKLVRTFIITLQSDLSSITVSNIIKGADYDFVFIQDATGGRTVTFPSELQFVGDLDLSPDAVTVYSGKAYSTSSVKDRAGGVSKATQSEAETGTEDVKYLTSNKGYLGWLSWVVNKTVSALNTTSKNIVGSINELEELESRYSNDGTPYANIAAANAAILEADRTIGLTVNIANVEYWWKDVLTDVGLVVKQSALIDGSNPTLQDSYIPALATSSDNQAATVQGITGIPVGDVSMLVNQDIHIPSNGDKTGNLYWSIDGGATALAFGSIVQGALPYWNGSIAGFELETSDNITYIYDV